MRGVGGRTRNIIRAIYSVTFYVRADIEHVLSDTGSMTIDVYTVTCFNVCTISLRETFHCVYVSQLAYITQFYIAINFKFPKICN